MVALLFEQLLICLTLSRLELTVFGSFSINPSLNIARLTRVLELLKIALKPFESGSEVSNFLNAFLLFCLANISKL